MLNHSSGGNSLPRHLQIHASLGGRCLDEERRITSRRPAQDHAGFVDSFANEFLGQLAGPQRPALVHLVRILAGKRSAADRHARSVVVDNELLSRKPVVPLGAADGEFPCPVEDKLVRRRRSKPLPPALRPPSPSGSARASARGSGAAARKAVSGCAGCSG